MTDPNPTPAPQARTVRHSFSTGLTLVADHWGPAQGAPVVFLHGGGQTRHSWTSTARTLAVRGHRSVTVDMRGHGESDWHPDGYYELDGYASDIIELIQSFEQKPVLVGASLGGLTGVLLEGKLAPGSIAALILVDIVPRMNRDGADRVLEFMVDRMTEGFATLDEVADAISAYNPHRPRPTDLQGLKKNLRQRDGRWFWHWDPMMLPGSGGDAEASARQVRNPELLAAAMANIDVPALLVRGRMSDLVTEEGAAQFLREHPEAHFVDVSGAGHMVAGDRNDVFTDAVLGFIDGLD